MKKVRSMADAHDWHRRSFESISGIIQWIKNIAADKLLLLVIVVSAAAQGFNMFGYPAYREDEGTYLSQAWSVINTYSLAPYTYWYDHAPLGWIFIALWNILTGGILIDNFSLNSGRIFMLVVNTVSTMLVYLITRHITKRRDAAVLAAFIFALSPLAIIFHRRILLDNIMVFWFLLSIYFLTKKPQLRFIIFSAISFAAAVLCKESAVFFLPIMIFIVATRPHSHHRHFALVTWITIAILLISFYPLMALLKGELFPAGTWLGGANLHVSLWDAINFQYQRGTSLLSNTPGSLLYALQNTWLSYGPILIILSLFATIMNLVNFKRIWHVSLSLLVVMYTIIILRGQVLDWYIIPLIPLFAFNVALLYSDWSPPILAVSKRNQYIRFFPLACIIFVITSQLLTYRFIFTLDQTKNQVDAVAWTKENIPRTANLLIDNYAFVDFNPKIDDITQTNVHYYWKADTDPIIRDTILKNDWNSIDYLLFTPAMLRTIYSDNLELVRAAFERSYVVKRFNLYDIAREGYPVEIREVNNNHSTLAKGWIWYKDTFIEPNGRVVDKANNNLTTSEAQSYALLRAVWQHDKETYDRVLKWTIDNLQKNGKLFAWHYGQDSNGVERIIDDATATDADEDIALSLLFASKLWSDNHYEVLAQDILNEIWNKEVVQIGDTYYLTAGTTAPNAYGYLINPSYLSPASYRVFASSDPNHPWARLAEDSYKILNRLAVQTDASSPKTELIPNWFVVDAQENFLPIKNTPKNANLYGYDAFRLMWRVALDATWFDSREAKTFLAGFAPFYKKEWEGKNMIAAEYALDGTPHTNYSDLSTSAGALAVLLVAEPDTAIDMFSHVYWPEFKDGYWGDEKNYYNQNWAWFATALYAHNLPNMWNDDIVLAK